jgi:hypothetical protein
MKQTCTLVMLMIAYSRGISYAHMDSTSEVVNSEHMNPPPRASCCRASHTVAASSINEAIHVMTRQFDAELRMRS